MLPVPLANIDTVVNVLITLRSLVYFLFLAFAMLLDQSLMIVKCFGFRIRVTHCMNALAQGIGSKKLRLSNPKTPPRRPKTPPRRPQDAPKTPTRHPKTPTRHPQDDPRRSIIIVVVHPSISSKIHSKSFQNPSKSFQHTLSCMSSSTHAPC